MNVGNALIFIFLYWYDHALMDSAALQLAIAALSADAAKQSIKLAKKARIVLGEDRKDTKLRVRWEALIYFMSIMISRIL